MVYPATRLTRVSVITSEKVEMKIRLPVVFLCATIMVNCAGPSSTQTSNEQQVRSQANKPTVLNKGQAISIAKAEAIKDQEPIDKYDVKALEETKAWRVEFELKDVTTMGGGLAYLIDK